MLFEFSGQMLSCRVHSVYENKMRNTGYMVIALFLILCTYFNSVASQTNGRNFVVVAPSRFGASEWVCINLLASPANVTISLLEQPSGDEITSVEIFNVVEFECLILSVPHGIPSTTAKLSVQVTFDDGATSNTLRNVSLIRDPWLTFIYTDKPIYGQNQLVRIRIFSVTTFFMPILETVEKIWLENPQGVHVAEWKNVKPSGGFIDVSYQLLSSPFPGTWTVKANVNGHEEKKSFLVEKHAFPNFEVQIETSNVVEGNSTMPVKVCARYSFDKPVSGEVQLNVAIECPFAYYCPQNQTSSSLSYSLNNDGCAEMSVKVEESENSIWRTLIINATVKELGTQEVQTFSKKASIIPSSLFNAVTSEFQFPTQIFKPGLPFYGELKLTSQGKPASDRPVTICRTYMENKKCNSSQTKNGTVSFVILSQNLPAEQLGEKLLLEATWNESQSREGKKSIFLHPWFSSSRKSLKIEVKNRQPLDCNSNLTVDIFHNLEESQNFFILIKSRGKILFLKNLPQLRDVKRSSYNLKAAEDIVTLADDVEPNSINIFSFTLPITASMSPSVSIVAYALESKHDLIADSIDIPVRICFASKVTAYWSTLQEQPGRDVQLLLDGEIGSTCAIEVTDKKVEIWNQETPKFKDIVFSRLSKKIKNDQRKSDYLHRPRDRCSDGESDVTHSMYNSLTINPERSSVYMDSFDIFENSGLYLISDAPFPTKPCRQSISVDWRGGPTEIDSSLFALTTVDSEGRSAYDLSNSEPDLSIRSSFPDSWIFELVSFGSESSINISRQLPDAITEWTAHINCFSPSGGLSILPQLAITSFKPFFLSIELPSLMKRQETIHLSVSVFSYINYSIPIKILMETSGHFEIKKEFYKSKCLNPQSQINIVVPVLAKKLGAAYIQVKAEVDESNDACGTLPSDIKIFSDTIKKEATIKGEGRAVEEIRSAMICGSETSLKTLKTSPHVDWSLKMTYPDYVEHTVNAEVRISGDIFGPRLLDADRLISQPIGCGEQNMLSFATNVLLMRYLLARESVLYVEPFVKKALKNLDDGYQQQLSFRHDDGSYSAFGQNYSESSIWLTALVVEYFTQAKAFVHLDEIDLEQTLNWLKSQQMENGCFPIIGEVYHWNEKRKLNGSESPKALTAYIIISLLKGNVTVSSKLIENAVFCLKASDVEDLYTDLLTVYALALAGETRDANWRMSAIMQTAQRSYQTLWWQSRDSSTIESSIEMTGYGVLILLKLGGSHSLSAAADAVRWLLQHQNSKGGFSSTQDSIVALEALAEYSEILPRFTDSKSLNVFLTYTGGNQSFEINDLNHQLQHITQIPPFLSNIKFEAIGSGCALVQAVLKYNVRRGEPGKSIKIQLSAEPVSTVDDSIRRLEVCSKTRSTLAATGMAIIEITLPTGYYPDRTSLYHIKLAKTGVIKWEEFEDHINFYFENLTQQKKCTSFLIRRQVCVDKPAIITAKAYDYYDSQHVSIVKHSWQQSCVFKDSWFLDNSVNENSRLRRDVASFSQDGSNLFFKMDDLDDLDVPGDDGYPTAVFALPPSKVEASNKCPQCFATPPELFPKLYCSSKLAAKIRIRGKQLLEIVKDLSPGRNSSKVSRTVGFTMKSHCSCSIFDAENSLAFVLVTPPRFFNLKSIQEIHLDESFAIFPWNSTSSYTSSIFMKTFDCNNLLSMKHSIESN